MTEGSFGDEVEKSREKNGDGKTACFFSSTGGPAGAAHATLGARVGRVVEPTRRPVTSLPRNHSHRERAWRKLRRPLATTEDPGGGRHHIAPDGEGAFEYENYHSPDHTY